MRREKGFRAGPPSVEAAGLPTAVVFSRAGSPPASHRRVRCPLLSVEGVGGPGCVCSRSILGLYAEVW